MTHSDEGVRSQGMDILLSGWFGVQAVLMVVVAIQRPGSQDASYDYGAALLIMCGFALPAFLYLSYNIAIFLSQWWQRKDFEEAWRSSFNATWAKRSAIFFGVAFVVNLGYLLPRPW